MIKKRVKVTLYIDIEVDEEKFGTKFMENFRESFYDFETLDDHIKHLAQLTAKGVIDEHPFNRNEFIEGYGHKPEMGIIATIEDQEEEIEAA